MELVIGILFVAGASAYFTSIPCRGAETRDRQAAWHYALAGVFGAAFLGILFIFQADLFRPSEWHKGKVEMTVMVPLDFVVCCGLALLPSLLVVWTYRRKYEDVHPPA